MRLEKLESNVLLMKFLYNTADFESKMLRRWVGPWVMASQQQPQNAQLPQSQSRQAAEEARKDRTLAEFLLMLDDYEPLVCLFHVPVSYV